MTTMAPLTCAGPSVHARTPSVAMIAAGTDPSYACTAPAGVAAPTAPLIQSLPVGAGSP